MLTWVFLLSSAIATATPINTSLSQTSSDSTPSSRNPYPRPQYTISRAHVTMDQNSLPSSQSMDNPYASHPPHVSYDPGPNMNTYVRWVDWNLIILIRCHNICILCKKMIFFTWITARESILTLILPIRMYCTKYESKILLQNDLNIVEMSHKKLLLTRNYPRTLSSKYSFLIGLFLVLRSNFLKKLGNIASRLVC